MRVISFGRYRNLPKAKEKLTRIEKLVFLLKFTFLQSRGVRKLRLRRRCMWNKIYPPLLLFLFSMSLLSQESVDQENPVIIWEPIPNASSYQLQIKNDSDEIIDEIDTKETSHKLNLDPGKYSHRVGTYNKFGKISSYSEWFPFIISKSLSPEVTSDRNNIGSKLEPQTKILIEGKNFYKDTRLILKNETETVSLISVKLKKGIFEVVIDNDKTKVGSYDLTIENPRKKILVLNNFFELKNESIPVVNPSNPEVTPDIPVTPTAQNSNYPYWKQAAKSTILPGWGQVSKEHYFSALFFDLGIIVGVAQYKATIDTFHSEKNKYNELVLRGLLYQAVEGQDFGLMYGYIASENQFHRAQGTATEAYQASIFLAAMYTLNILDSLLWKTSSDLSENSTTIRFYTKISPATTANTYFTPNQLNHSSQIELGLRFQF